MILVDSLFIGGLRFILDKIRAAVDAELNDPDVLRERLLEAQMRLETGELTEAEFADLERALAARIAELRGRRTESVGEDVKITGVEIDVAGEPLPVRRPRRRRRRR